MNEEGLDRIIAHLIATLPDSIERRMRLLTDALAILPSGHPMRERLATMLTFLESHQRQQLEFPAIFTSDSYVQFVNRRPIGSSSKSPTRSQSANK